MSHGKKDNTIVESNSSKSISPTTLFVILIFLALLKSARSLLDIGIIFYVAIKNLDKSGTAFFNFLLTGYFSLVK